MGVYAVARWFVVAYGRWLALAVGVAALGGCAHRVPLQPESGCGAAIGRLTVIEKDYGIRVVSLQVRELDKAQVGPGARTFVVWARAGADDLTNMGALTVREDGEAVLEALAPPAAEFQLFVTAEPTADVTTPSEARLFSASVGP
jgi:hypothetical protein